MRLAVGDMRVSEMVQTLDWTQTPLGPAASWPQSLRTTTDLCLASRFPIVIYWGPELVTIYNDAYAPILGSKHPWALGRPCREVWGEIWDVIQPMLADVMETGAATWSDDLLLVLERRGYPEECYFSFSFTPVREETGRVAGVFTAVIETTERVVGARRLLTLRELGQHVTEAGGVEQACRRAADTLAANTSDLPFAWIYLLNSQRRQLTLTTASGLVPPASSALEVVELDRPLGSLGLALARAAAGERRAERVDLGDTFADLRVNESQSPPESAMVLPITRAGEVIPYGVLVAGISPQRRLDEPYRGFYDLLADGLTTVVANVRAHEEERARAQALAELDRAKTTFFSNVSHEFRTPLTLMLGPLEDLLLSSLPADARAELDVIHRNGLRLLKLVNALLDFSRIETGRLEAMYEPTDLAALTADLAAVFRSAIEHAGLRLHVDCPPLPEPVHVDREMWEKVVLNLLSNAFKFTLRGEISLRLRVEGDSVELSVRDTGVGIPASDLPHVFKRFHRVRGSLARTQEGTGIGLALVQELVTLHSGVIRVDSVEGRGTTLTVSIPRGRAHLPAAHIRAPRTLASTSTTARAYADEALRWLPDEAVVEPDATSAIVTDQSEDTAGEARPYILCADDNADMRAYLSRLLGSRYDVESVPDGESALKAAQRRVPDIVVSDVMMPGLDGLGLLQALRQDPKTSLVPVVLLSARAGEESRIDGLRSGADDYLVKPFSSRELLARLDAGLEIARVRKGMLRKEQAGIAAIDASEAQRRRLSRELHDELGQELTALVLGLKTVKDAVGPDSPVRDQVEHLQALATQVSHDMHHIALELRPGAIDEHGLQTALSNYIDEWSRRNDIGADFQLVALGTDRFPPYVETTIYRIIQEALTNVTKHARAASVNVIVQRDGGDVVAIVEDDGCGFDVASRSGSARLEGRLGLLGMKERAALVGGTCEIESRTGSTTVIARIPLALG
jgi:signal transduction histidine kinase